MSPVTGSWGLSCVRSAMTGPFSPRFYSRLPCAQERGYSAIHIYIHVSIWERMDTWICVAKSLHCSPETITTLLIGYQFSSVTQSCPTLWDPMNHSTPGLPVHHQLPEFTQTHVHWVSDAIQPSHPLSSPSPLAPNPSQHQGLFQWLNSSHQVAKVLEFELQHQSFQWTPRTDLL